MRNGDDVVGVIDQLEGGTRMLPIPMFLFAGNFDGSLSFSHPKKMAERALARPFSSDPCVTK